MTRRLKIVRGDGPEGVEIPEAQARLVDLISVEEHRPLLAGLHRDGHLYLPAPHGYWRLTPEGDRIPVSRDECHAEQPIAFITPDRRLVERYAAGLPLSG